MILPKLHINHDLEGRFYKVKAMKKLILKTASVIAFAALGLAAAPSQAHHAFAAEFDASKPITVKGAVTKVRYVNPHSWIYVDVKNPDGTVTNWGFEFGTPASIENAGLSKADFTPGKVITLQGFRSKNGGPFGHAVKTTLADGRSIGTGSAPDEPGATKKPAGNGAY